jgi:hypothetical protein
MMRASGRPEGAHREHREARRDPRGGRGALQGRRLLSHPFYQRWSRGDLRLGELGAYAGQYRFIEARLPGWLESIQSSSCTAHFSVSCAQRECTSPASAGQRFAKTFDGRGTVEIGAGAATRLRPTVRHSTQRCPHGHLSI